MIEIIPCLFLIARMERHHFYHGMLLYVQSVNL